jgi:dipeptidyl aminopeptidase/acylaminoacyl peptidase
VHFEPEITQKSVPGFWIGKAIAIFQNNSICMRNFLLLICTLLFAPVVYAQNGTELVQVTDLLKIKTVGNITATKDGSRVAFTVTSVEPDAAHKEDYRYVTQVYTVSTAEPYTLVQLTTAKEGASQPAWSPDGSELAFVRAVDGKPQIFLISMEGGEPRQLTKYKYGASNPKWSPDGNKILFSSSIALNDYLKDSLLNASKSVPAWPFEKPGLPNDRLRTNNTKPDPNGTMAEVRAYLDMDANDKKAIVLNKLDFQSETNVSSEMDFNQLLVIDAEKGGEPTLLTKGFYSFNNAVFTPDGKQLIISGDMDSTEHPDRSLESEIYVADADGQHLKKLYGQAGLSYTNASLSPSGKWLVFQVGSTTSVSIPALNIVPFRGSTEDIMTIPFDRNRGNFIWENDDYFYFTSPSNGGVTLNRVNTNTKKVETLSKFDAGITSYDIAGDKIVFSKTQVSNPSELFLADANMEGERQLSNFNDWVKTRKLSFPQKATFVNEKGMTVEYWVMKPVNYQQGKKYPLLLEIHGGPASMWGPGEASMWHEYQYFCSKGYGVVYSNPRGSGGYGTEFLRGNIADWGTGPASDVLTSLDKAVAQGWADTSRLLITGGSYAGYLTAWIISHDKRFKAACSQRGVYDLATFFGEGNAWRLVPAYFGGYPWDAQVKALLQRESPITYVQNITTPYIIFHGGNDRRTGFVQGEMMYRSLKVLGRPVEYVVHPNATHEITRSGDNRQRIDQMLRTWEFFERWMK